MCNLSHGFFLVNISSNVFFSKFYKHLHKYSRILISFSYNTSELRKTLSYNGQKCPNTELFLVRIFLYSDRIQENKDQKKLRIWTLFMQ